MNRKNLCILLSWICIQSVYSPRHKRLSKQGRSIPCAVAATGLVDSLPENPAESMLDIVSTDMPDRAQVAAGVLKRLIDIGHPEKVSEFLAKQTPDFRNAILANLPGQTIELSGVPSTVLTYEGVQARIREMLVSMQELYKELEKLGEELDSEAFKVILDGQVDGLRRAAAEEADSASYDRYEHDRTLGQFINTVEQELARYRRTEDTMSTMVEASVTFHICRKVLRALEERVEERARTYQTLSSGSSSQD